MNSLKGDTTEVLASKTSTNIVHFRPPDNFEANIQRHKHVKDDKNVSNVSWQVENEILNDCV